MSANEETYLLRFPACERPHGPKILNEEIL